MALESLDNRIDIARLNIDSTETRKSPDIAEKLVSQHAEEIIDDLTAVTPGSTYELFAGKASMIKIIAPEVFHKIGVGEGDKEQLMRIFNSKSTSNITKLYLAESIKTLFPQEVLQFPPDFTEKIRTAVNEELDPNTTTQLSTVLSLARACKIANLDAIDDKHRKILQSNILNALKDKGGLLWKAELVASWRILFPEQPISREITATQLEPLLKERIENGWTSFLRAAYMTKLYLAKDLRVTESGLQLDSVPQSSQPDLTMPEQRNF
jgi:hypothetical protein